MERFDLEIGLAVAVLLHGEFANGHLGHRRRERAAADVIAFLPPETATQALGLEVIKSRQLVKRPVGIDGSGPLEIGPEDDLRFCRAEETRLRAGAEAVVVDLRREFLRAFERVANGGLAALIAGEGQVNARGAQGGIDGRIDDLIEGFLERGPELKPHAVAKRIERPPLRIVGGCVLRAEFIVDALQSASLARGVEHFLESIPRARKKEDAVLVLLLTPPCLPVSRDR